MPEATFTDISTPSQMDLPEKKIDRARVLILSLLTELLQGADGVLFNVDPRHGRLPKTWRCWFRDFVLD